MLWAFLPIAALLTITPGPATATVVRTAVRGRRLAFMSALGNSAGGLPFTVLFDRGGRVVQRRLGATSRDELARWVGLL